MSMDPRGEYCQDTVIRESSLESMNVIALPSTFWAFFSTIDFFAAAIDSFAIATKHPVVRTLGYLSP